MRDIILEVCVDSLESASAAVEGGARRLEVCGNLPLFGGTTPSLGLVRSIQKYFPSVPLMVGTHTSVVMIRPRVGDFVFSAEEIETMMEDISTFRTLGVHGVVIGALLSDGSVDREACTRLTVAALPMQVTFHRAFDLTADPNQALKDIAKIPGITRILTSGHATPRVYEPTSLERLAELVASALSTYQPNKGPHHIADATLRIVPGSGINPQTIGRVFSAVGELVDEYHMSGGSWIDGPAHICRGEEFQMGPRGHERAVWKTDASQVRGVVQALAQMRGGLNA
ncbi:unnamed protein product [Rhizoctonia solani]|uniref:Copper homeostasis protein cutC homolog n=1 Tax=Rhizoctonia solani TaxID=456999 RepID=A0A8H2X861_9AGAM|nr:unnamed protein product [Rhizoctonia solani]